MPGNNGFRTVRQQVVDRLRAQVMSGQFQPGDPLREVKLAEQFGVSRGPVRDALLQLSQEGLLSYKPNSGVRVTEPPGDATRDLVVDLRRQIEVFAIRSALGRMSDEHRRQWDAALARLHAACRVGDPGEIVEADVSFHQWIIEGSGHADLLPIWKMLCAGMRFTYTRMTDHMQIYAEHLAIVEAFDRGDPEAAVRAIEENIV